MRGFVVVAALVSACGGPDVIDTGPPQEASDASDTGASDDASDASAGDSDPSDTSADPSDTEVPADTDTSTDTSTDTEPDPDPPRCGDGEVNPELGEQCDDANLDPNDACSNACRARYACPVLPLDCSAATGSTAEHTMRALDACSFALVEEDTAGAATRDARVDALAALVGGPLSIADVFSDLNREGRAGISAQSAERLQNHAWEGFRWNDGDENTSDWYPQGITGSSDADDAGRVSGRRALLVSWYHKTDARPTKGARLSLVDLSDESQPRYRHLLLVEPYDGPSGPNFRAVETAGGDALHAGGLAWLGDRLYVADTGVGLRVFDLSRVMRVPNVDDNARIGVSAGRVDAHGYRYVVPQVGRYRQPTGACPLRFSFVSLDRSSAPWALVTGEYATPEVTGRLARWPLDPTTGLPALLDGEVRANAAVIGGQSRVQGGTTWGGDWYLSSSSQAGSFGRLYRTRPGLTSSISAWVYGAEDLYYERDTTLLWTPAEHPGSRDVVGIPMRAP